jgi:hypothetical protein
MADDTIKKIIDIYSDITDIYSAWNKKETVDSASSEAVMDLRTACGKFLAATDANDTLRSLLGSLMTQDAGMLEVSIERAHKVLGIEEDAKDTDSVLKLFGYDRNAD